MAITNHILAAGALVLTAAGALWLPLSGLGEPRPIPTESLTVPASETRPAVLTANQALAPVVPAFSQQASRNPFTIPEAGEIGNVPVPPPPPPPLDLPTPPLTPFSASGR